MSPRSTCQKFERGIDPSRSLGGHDRCCSANLEARCRVPRTLLRRSAIRRFRHVRHQSWPSVRFQSQHVRECHRSRTGPRERLCAFALVARATDVGRRDVDPVAEAFHDRLQKRAVRVPSRDGSAGSPQRTGQRRRVKDGPPGCSASSGGLVGIRGQLCVSPGVHGNPRAQGAAHDRMACRWLLAKRGRGICRRGRDGEQHEESCRSGRERG